MTTSYGRRSTGVGKKKTLAAFVTALLVLLVLALPASPASAQQANDQRVAGPVNPDHGFPFWYQDATGLRLDLCLEQNGLCLTEEPDPNSPISFPDNFGGEAFWWAAETSVEANGVSALLTLASEAAFANEEPVDGDQVAFGRVRIRASGLEPGTTYRVTHPYGADTFVAENAVRNINDTRDIGCFDTPCADNFARATQSPVFGGFLYWDTLGTGADEPPAGYVGDPAVPHTVEGSPTGNNFFRIEELDGNGNVVRRVGQTNEFSIMGKLSGLNIVASPRGGEFEQAQKVSLTASEPGANIFYTTDGSDPTTASEQYAGQPITISRTTTLKFMALDGNGDPRIFQQKYLIRPPTSTSLKSGVRILSFGRSTLLSGQVVSGGDPLAGQRVVLLQRPAGQKGFSRVPGGVLTTNGKGNFSKKVKPRKKTIYRARFVGAAEGPRASMSGPVTVNVRARVTLNISSADLKLGQSRLIRGAVLPAHRGKVVRLVVRRGGTVVRTANVRLNSRSRYAFSYRPTAPGVYRVRTTFVGDPDHLGNASPLGKFRVVR